jgi:molecular chaperone GrpE
VAGERTVSGRGADTPSPGRRSAGVPVEEASTPPPATASPVDEAEAVEQDLDDLSKAQAERDEYLELAQRTRADFENYRKRMAAEVESAARRGKREVIGELITVLDNLERALEAAGIDPAAAAGDEQPEVKGALEQGLVLTCRDLAGALSAAGVEAVDPAGEAFDPNLHEALQTRSAEGVEPGSVLDVVQRGYRLDGQLIRPARVVVSE